jgi:hypothetical protein
MPGVCLYQEEDAMSLCAVCGSELSDSSSLCRHHHLAGEDRWSEGNRILCDLLHRGKEPGRLPRDLREDEVAAA